MLVDPLEPFLLRMSELPFTIEEVKNERFSLERLLEFNIIFGLNIETDNHESGGCCRHKTDVTISLGMLKLADCLERKIG